jgi:hypothetical protein
MLRQSQQGAFALSHVVFALIGTQGGRPTKSDINAVMTEAAMR